MNEEIEVLDFRYDEGFRSRKEKTILPTLTTKGGGGYEWSTVGKE